MFTQCFVNITDPAVYDTEACRNSQADSDYYKYSIPGFDPCFFFDFSQEYTFKYKLVCKTIDSNGMVSMKPQSMGYDYRDVTKFIDTPSKNSSSDRTQNLSNLRVDNKKVTVIIDFKDWKYLSST